MGKIEWTGRGDWNPQGLNRSQRAMIGARLIGAGVTHGGDRRSRAWNTAGPRRRSCRELAVAALRMSGSSCRAALSRSSPPWNEANLPSHRWDRRCNGGSRGHSTIKARAAAWSAVRRSCRGPVVSPKSLLAGVQKAARARPGKQGEAINGSRHCHSAASRPRFAIEFKTSLATGGV